MPACWASPVTCITSSPWRVSSPGCCRAAGHHALQYASKWNKIEHRLFSAITQNWRGKPLVSHEVVVNLIGATTTTTGLTVRSELDPNNYPAGRVVTDDELSTIHIRRDAFHGDWNYALLPRPGLL